MPWASSASISAIGHAAEPEPADGERGAVGDVGDRLAGAGDDLVHVRPSRACVGAGRRPASGSGVVRSTKVLPSSATARVQYRRSRSSADHGGAVPGPRPVAQRPDCAQGGIRRAGWNRAGTAPMAPTPRRPRALLEPEDTLEDTHGVRDVLDTGWSPPERPWAVDDWGTTEVEESAGESLDGRLAREVPDGVDRGRRRARRQLRHRRRAHRRRGGRPARRAAGRRPTTAAPPTPTTSSTPATPGSTGPRRRRRKPPCTSSANRTDRRAAGRFGGAPGGAGSGHGDRDDQPGHRRDAEDLRAAVRRGAGGEDRPRRRGVGELPADHARAAGRLAAGRGATCSTTTPTTSPS